MQSEVVATETVPAPPPAGMEPCGNVTEIWHFAGDGLLLVADELHPATARVIADTSANAQLCDGDKADDLTGNSPDRGYI